jgi:hypothetical protein
MGFEAIFPQIRDRSLLSTLVILVVIMPDGAFAGAPFQTDDPAVIYVTHPRPRVQPATLMSGRSGVLAGAEIHYGLIRI